MRFRILALLMLLGVATAAPAQVNIGISFSLFPELVRVPDYPVYYAPRADANYFFYDGLYWVFRDDDWYSSDWYNGPWYRVAPEFVPLYVLRVPVRYYRRPPPYFRGWGRDAPPRWGQHWGRDWEQNHSGWDRWNRRSAPAPAPLPTYQRQYSGNRYPRPEERHAIADQKYRYQPKDQVVREHVRPEIRAGAPAATAGQRQPEPRKDAGKDNREPPRKDAGKDMRDREPRKDAGKDVREPPRKDAGKDMRDREPPRKEVGKDTRERDQKSAPVRPAAPPKEPAARPQSAPPPVRERPPEAARKDSRPDAREREQKSPPAAPREPPPPRPAAPPPRPAAPPPPPPHPAAPPPPPRPQPQAAPPGKGPEHEKGGGQEKGGEREKGGDHNK